MFKNLPKLKPFVDELHFCEAETNLKAGLPINLGI